MAQAAACGTNAVTVNAVFGSADNGCTGDLNGDTDVDGTDAANFKFDFGRSRLNNPCDGETACDADFDCDGDVDGTDAAGFKGDFGRSPLNNPCPAGEPAACSY